MSGWPSLQLAAICWGLYIVFTQQVGDRFRGIQGLALATPVAAVTASFVGVPQAWGNLSWEVLAWGVVLAVLTPVFPFALEMLALKRMNTRAFGTLMAVEPGVATGIGLLLLFQVRACSMRWASSWSFSQESRLNEMRAGRLCWIFPLSPSLVKPRGSPAPRQSLGARRFRGRRECLPDRLWESGSSAPARQSTFPFAPGAHRYKNGFPHQIRCGGWGPG